MRSRRASAKELSVSTFTFEFPMFNDDISAREHGFDRSTNPPAFIRAVVHTHMMGFCADRLFFARVKDHDVRIGTNRFLGKSPKILAAAVDVNSTKRFRLIRP